MVSFWNNTQQNVIYKLKELQQKQVKQNKSTEQGLFRDLYENLNHDKEKDR